MPAVNSLKIRFELSAINDGNIANPEFDGTFNFTTSDGDLLLGGTFREASLFPRLGRHGGDSASFLRRDLDGDLSVQFRFGPDLLALPGHIHPQHFRINMWGVRFDDSGQLASLEERDFMGRHFTAKGSFFALATATPQPSSSMLAGLAFLLISVRQSRPGG